MMKMCTQQAFDHSSRTFVLTFTLFLLLVKSTFCTSDSDYFPYETSLLSLDKGEYQRLLQDYPVNRDLIRSVGTDYYQIVNVVQFRHHQYLGLSTREGNSKSQRSQPQGIQATQQFSRTGKHYHRTSFIIQAFNHKFRLILELNTPLIAPNVLQAHIFSPTAEQRERNDLEMCYYHGNVEGLEWSAAAVRTCNGLSGIIHMGNETFIIHPFYGGDMSNNHPHIVFEAKSVGRQTCGNRRGYEFEGGFQQSGYQGGTSMGMSSLSNSGSDYVRRSEDKGPNYFIELAVLLDRAMFDKRNGSTRLQVIHDALQIVNIADLYFRKLNTAISVVYVETWHQENHLGVAKVNNLQETLTRLTNFYGPRNLFTVNKDTTMLISGINFSESGMGVPRSICTARAMGVVTDVSTYQPHITGVALAHMIGHNLNMGHDEDVTGDVCHCPNWYGCIMSEKIVGQDGIQPYRFSDCSRKSYLTSITTGHGMCLINKPNTIDPVHKTCGNGILEAGEECDCGSVVECAKDPCCQPMVCRLKTTAQCSSGQPCCENCQYKGSESVCRPPQSECDIPEFCTGASGECPLDTYKKNGALCENKEGFCFNGFCPSHDSQCRTIWGPTAKKSEDKCFVHLNVYGAHTGNCGREEYGGYRKCDLASAPCGTLHCQSGSLDPVLPIFSTSSSVSKITLHGNIECKNINSPRADENLSQFELVRDGTKCDKDMICMNQTCVRLAYYVDNQRCPSNHVGLDCSGNGECSNVNICYCKPGFEGPDCSIINKDAGLGRIIPPPEYPTASGPMPPPPSSANQSGGAPLPPPTNATVHENKKQTTRKETDDGSSTIVLVFGMVTVVGGVFVFFAMIALCYRRSSPPKFDPTAYPTFNPKTYKLPQPPQPSTHGQGPGSGGGQPQPSHQNQSQNLPQPQLVNHDEIDNRILSLTQLPTFRDQHNVGLTGSMKNLGGVGGHHNHPGEDETGDETSAFLGTLPTGFLLRSCPEKGILKKYVEEDGSGSDNNEGLCEVERTLKSLNGYHEDILAALRVAAAQRGMGDPSMTPPPQVFNPGGGTRLGSDGYPDFPDYGNEFSLLRNSSDRISHSHGQTMMEDESNDDAGGPIRIRNLEDLLRQLEHHSGARHHHLSPCGSEDIRLSETEADRHYRLHSADLSGDEEAHLLESFVMGRYRSPGMVPSSIPNNRRTPSDYDHTAAPLIPTFLSPDDIESNQQNVLHTSTSEDEEDGGGGGGGGGRPTSHSHSHHHQPSSRSLTPRNLKHLYNPSDESYGSQSPLHLNGIPIPVVHHLANLSSSGGGGGGGGSNRYSTSPNVYHQLQHINLGGSNSRQSNGGSGK